MGYLSLHRVVITEDRAHILKKSFSAEEDRQLRYLKYMLSVSVL